MKAEIAGESRGLHDGTGKLVDQDKDDHRHPGSAEGLLGMDKGSLGSKNAGNRHHSLRTGRKQYRATFKMKVYVNIENRTGSRVRLSHCFFKFHRPRG